MKKFINKINEKATAVAIKAQTTLDNVKGEGYIDTGVKIIIGVVVGAVIQWRYGQAMILLTLHARSQRLLHYNPKS